MEVAFLVIPVDEIWKVWKNRKAVKTGMVQMHRVYVLWNKLLTLPGGQKVLNKMPQSWKNLPGSKLQPDNNSLKWVQPGGGHHFRLSDKKAYPNYENDKYPYAEFFKNGSFRDINGNSVPLQSNAAHIKIDNITDDFLNWFFN